MLMNRVRLWGLFLFLIGSYLLTAGGHVYVTDGAAMFEMSLSILDHGWFDVPLNPNTQGGKIGRDGLYYMPFGVLHPLAAAPLALLGRVLTPWAQTQYLAFFTATWLNVLATALLFVILARWFIALGTTSTQALILAVGSAFSTPFWVYAQTFFAEPLTSVGLLYAGYAIFRYGEEPKASVLVKAGLSAGGAVLARPISGIALPVLVLYLLLVLGRRKPKIERRRFSELALFGVILLAALGLLALYNYARFGEVLETGYEREPNGSLRTFTMNPLTGLLILLLSPGKSMFLYCPLGVLGVWGALSWLKRQQRRPEGLLALVMVGVFLAILSQWGRVEGGVTWGPRLLLPALPFLLLGLGGFVEQGTRLRRSLVYGLSIAGLGIQTLGAFVNFSTYISTHSTEYYDPDLGIYSFDFNPLAGHIREAAANVKALARLQRLPDTEGRTNRSYSLINYPEGLDVWWLHYWQDGVNSWFITGLLVSQLALGGIGLILLIAPGRVPQKSMHSNDGLSG